MLVHQFLLAQLLKRLVFCSILLYLAMTARKTIRIAAVETPDEVNGLVDNDYGFLGLKHVGFLLQKVVEFLSDLRNILP